MGRYETLKYDVAVKEGPFEIRTYQPFDTVSCNESELKGTRGFRMLFNYISGDNDKRQNISMTVPVINSLGKKSMTMEFVVPSEVSREGIPSPLDNTLAIRHHPGQKVAVYTFRGRTDNQTIMHARAQLEDWIRSRNVGIPMAFRLARFQPPFIPGIFKKNEMHAVLDA